MCSIYSSSDFDFGDAEPCVPSMPSPSSSSNYPLELGSLCEDVKDGDILAAEINEFSSLFLPSSVSSSLCYSPSWAKMGMEKLCSLTSSSSVKGLFHFDELNIDNNLDSLAVFDQYLAAKVEKHLPLVTSTSCSLPPHPPCSSSSTLTVPRLSVPIVPAAQPLDLATAYYAQEVPKEPGLFIASQVRTASKKNKRKRCAAVVDEECETDGVLFNMLMDACARSKKVPCLVKTDTGLAKKNRLAAKLKLEMKKKNRKLNQFNGHYPERKAVACSRKRVGGRFVKEKKSVFRPVQQSTVTV